MYMKFLAQIIFPSLGSREDTESNMKLSLPQWVYSLIGVKCEQLQSVINCYNRYVYMMCYICMN